MSKTYTVPPQPPHNEGKTPAAWLMTVGVVLGATVAAFGLVQASLPVIGIGAGMVALTLLVSFVMRLAGMGQKTRRATAR